MNSYDYLMDLRKRAAQIIDDAWHYNQQEAPE
jgi:hypothetical protein